MSWERMRTRDKLLLVTAVGLVFVAAGLTAALVVAAVRSELDGMTGGNATSAGSPGFKVKMTAQSSRARTIAVGLTMSMPGSASSRLRAERQAKVAVRILDSTGKEVKSKKGKFSDFGFS